MRVLTGNCLHDIGALEPGDVFEYDNDVFIRLGQVEKTVKGFNAKSHTVLTFHFEEKVKYYPNAAIVLNP